MKLKVIKPFDWAHQHVRVESFVKDQVIETEDEALIRVSTKEGWARAVRGKAGEQAQEAPETSDGERSAANGAPVADPSEEGLAA
jgi:hypothetical protein